MKFVIIESPFAGDIEANIAYARLCVRDSILRGEAPFASHLLYTQPNILDDNIPNERSLGIECGLNIAKHADITAVYTDRGISRGMEYGIKNAEANGRPIEYRTLETK